MLAVLTKPADYPDFVLGSGVIVDLPEKEAQRLFQAEAAIRWAGAPGDLDEVKRRPKQRKRRRGS